VTVLSDVYHRARKAHTCDFCDRRIQPDEHYRRVRAISIEGDPYTYKECLHCRSFIEVCPLWRDFGDDDYGLDPDLIRNDWEPADEFCQEMKRQFVGRWREPDSVQLYPIPPSEHAGRCGVAQ
jgi:hypothetical protein